MRNLAGTLLTLATVLLALAISPPRAQACLCLGYLLVPHVPSQGATDVPVDTALVVSAWGDAPVMLETTDGEPVALEELLRLPSSWFCGAAMVLLRPTAALAPNTQYTLTLDLVAPEFDPSSFTTGSQAGPAPTTPAFTVNHFRELFSTGMADSCAPQDTIGWPARSHVFVAPDGADASILVRLRGPDGSGGWIHHSGVTQAQDEPLHLPLPHLGGEQCLELDAYDLSGALVGSEELCQPSKCANGDAQTLVSWFGWEAWSEVPAGGCAPPPAADSGPFAGDTAGMEDAAPANQDDGDPGCGVAGTQSAGWALAALLLFLAWGARTRSRRSTRSEGTRFSRG